MNSLRLPANFPDAYDYSIRRGIWIVAGTGLLSGFTPALAQQVSPVEAERAARQDADAVSLPRGEVPVLGANRGDIVHAGSGAAGIEAADIVNAGRIVSNGAIGVTAASLSNSGELVAQNALSATASTSLANGGTIAGGGGVGLSAPQFAGMGGSVEAGGALAISGGAIDLGGGRYVTAGAAPLAITATNNLIATAATIGGNGDVSLSAPNTLALGGSRVTALGSILLDSGTSLTLGDRGVVAAAGSVAILGRTTVDAAVTLIQAGAEARFARSSVILDDSIVEAGGFAFDTGSLSLQRAKLRHTGTGDFVLTSAGTLDYSGGEIYSAGATFTIDAASPNQGGAILHAGNGMLDIDVAGAVDNQGGTIATNGTLSLVAAGVKNSGGTMTAAAGAVLSSAAAFVNDGGLIASGGNLALTAGDVSNLGGAIEAQGAIDIRADTYTGAGGHIVSSAGSGSTGSSIPPGSSGVGAALTLILSGAVTGAGLIGSDGEVDVAAGSITLGTGDRITGSALTLRATGGDIALGGAQIDGGSIALDAGTYVARGDNSPEAQAALESEIEQIYAREIVVTANKLTRDGAAPLSMPW